MRESGPARPRRRKSLLRTMIREVAKDQMGSVALAMMLALVVFLAYIGVYAKVTKNGYYRSSQVGRLREARAENQRLRADIQILSSPERLRRIAEKAGMRQCQAFDYLPGRATVVVAEARHE